MCSIFPYQNDLLGCSISSTQGLNKIAVYFYKFKEFSRRKSLIFPGVLQAHANQDT